MSSDANMTSANQEGKAPSRSAMPGKPLFKDMVWIPGGTFLMGSDHHYPSEAPGRTASEEHFDHLLAADGADQLTQRAVDE